MNMQREQTYTITVLRTPEGFLEDVWEEWEDAINYSFTDDPLRAWKFKDMSSSTPKYLWDEINEKSIDTISEACKYFNGDLVTYEVKTILTLKEVLSK